MYVFCYWDSAAEDHIIEVKRVKGDGLTPMSVDFFSRLRCCVTNQADDGLHARRGKLRGEPLPMPVFPSSSSSSAPKPSGFPLPPLPLGRNGGKLGLLSAPAAVCCGAAPDASLVTEELFLKGIRPILSMATDGLFEPRLEAAKMLCDLATKEKKSWLENQECVDICVKSLEKLLNDEFEDVNQFAVVAFALFAEIPVYQKLLSKFVLDNLIKLISNAPRDTPSYSSAQMRRKAAQGLSILSKFCSKELSEQLIKNGYENEQDWLDHCATVFDKKTREFALQMSACYGSV
jgi:hypothetical protein